MFENFYDNQGYARPLRAGGIRMKQKLGDCTEYSVHHPDANHQQYNKSAVAQQDWVMGTKFGTAVTMTLRAVGAVTIL